MSCTRISLDVYQGTIILHGTFNRQEIIEILRIPSSNSTSQGGQLLHLHVRLSNIRPFLSPFTSWIPYLFSLNFNSDNAMSNLSVWTFSAEFDVAGFITSFTGLNRVKNIAPDYRGERLVLYSIRFVFTSLSTLCQICHQGESFLVLYHFWQNCDCCSLHSLTRWLS